MLIQLWINEWIIPFWSSSFIFEYDSSSSNLSFLFIIFSRIRTTFPLIVSSGLIKLLTDFSFKLLVVGSYWELLLKESSSSFSDWWSVRKVHWCAKKWHLCKKNDTRCKKMTSVAKKMSLVAKKMSHPQKK